MAAYRSRSDTYFRRVTPTWLVIMGFISFILGVTLWQETAAHIEGMCIAAMGILAFTCGLWLRFRWPESRQRFRRAVELDSRLTR